jgi:Domain of unknown function (DUF397)
MSSPDLTRIAWRKSSYSGANGSCVEVAPVPTRRAGAAARPGMVAVRDTKDRGGPALIFTAAQWRAFASGVKAGEFYLA